MLPPYIQRQKKDRLSAPRETENLEQGILDRIRPPGSGQRISDRPPGSGQRISDRPPGSGQRISDRPPGSGQPDRLAEILGGLQSGMNNRGQTQGGQNVPASQPTQGVNNSMSSLLSIIKLLIQSGQLRG